MLFFSSKLFIFILILNLILVLDKNNNLNIFEKIQNNKQIHIRINKYLAEYIKNENTNYESEEFDSLYEELVKQKLKNYQKLMDLRKKEKNYEKKKLKDKMWQDKVVRSKIKAYYILSGDYNKYYEMCYSFKFIETKNKTKNKLYEICHSFNLIETKNKIKNKLYEIIFKGTRFWDGLGNLLELIGICALENMVVAIINSIVYILSKAEAVTIMNSIAIVPGSIYGVLIFLIIITIVVVILIVIWLWPKKQTDSDENTLDTT
ncbi:Hypotetical protein [Plasmodium sp. gorilla clade G2]|uniref:Hypotetical protein n=1 Tax=Plasmodium sp. gorilla clade G2 TaxID=880535 RepID=UPI000D2EC5FC|nr:Hypotetical protein [Plasmodium sp. gorilla clade G2]SOV20172.1 Hypotetical protein [Plasmodium sp. gorilla clade G2]